MSSSRGGLGRGLGALIPEGAPPPRDPRIPTTEVPVDRVVPNPMQPRTAMDPEALAELTESVRMHGVIQPLLVSVETGEGGQTVYQLIAGERRLRAARDAGLERVPVTVRQTTPQELLELAIIENVQRADLSPLEEAVAYQRLSEEFHLTQREIAERVGKSRAAVTNTMRLIDLSAEIRASLAAADITEGHARALLGTNDVYVRRSVWQRVVAEKLTVRDTERLVRQASKPPAPPKPAEMDSAHDALVQSLQRNLGTKVSLRRSAKGAGSLTIHFFSDEEFEAVLDRLGVSDL